MDAETKKYLDIIFQNLNQKLDNLKEEMNDRFDKVELRFNAIEAKIDNLGEDVNLITTKVFANSEDIREHDKVISKLAQDYVKRH